MSKIRTFSTGATRDTDEGKLKYEGFISPAVLHRFAEYMHENRRMRDGSLRDPDNWQKGIDVDAYYDSLIRHVIDLWREHRDAMPMTTKEKRDLLCAVIFNASGILYEDLVALGSIPRGIGGVALPLKRHPGVAEKD